MAKRVTSFEVAKRAGVSRTTVSFVLNDVEANISEETRGRVLKAARELGYVPNAAARTLASRQTRTLGLVLYDAQHLQVDAFISQVLYSLMLVSRREGFRVLVESVEDVSGQDAYVSLVRAKQIDGLVILNPQAGDEQLPRLVDQGFPIVIVGKIEHEGVCAVYHSSGARLITRHLLDLGHERIAHITYAPTCYLSSDHRLRNYRRALEGAGLPYREELVRVGNFTAASGYEAMHDLLLTGPRPTAVFAGNDTVALGALAALHEHDLRVPDDISVVGYDDIPLAAYAVPPLTTVHTPALEQGRLAGEMLINLIRGEAPAERQVRLLSELVIRASSGPPPVLSATGTGGAQL